MLTVLRRLFRRIDAVVLCCALGLSAFSVVLLLGIQQMGVIGRRTVLMQVVAAGLGFIAAMVLAHLDYEQLGSWWKFYVPVAVVLMLLTFTPLGQTRTDSIETNRSWLNLGFTTIQPAEFLKIAFILSLAYHLSKVGASLNGSKTLLRVGGPRHLPGAAHPAAKGLGRGSGHALHRGGHAHHGRAFLPVDFAGMRRRGGLCPTGLVLPAG